MAPPPGLCKLCMAAGGDDMCPSPCQCRGNVHLRCLQVEFEERRCWDDLLCPRCRYPYETRVAVHLGKIALREVINEHGPEHPLVADALANIGNSYGHFGDNERQREYLERALEIDASRYSLFVNVGKAYGQLGQLRKQREYLEHAVRMIEEQHGQYHSVLAPIFIVFGDLQADVKIATDWSATWEDDLFKQLVKYADARSLPIHELEKLVSVVGKHGRSLALSFDAEGCPSLLEELPEASPEVESDGLACDCDTLLVDERLLHKRSSDPEHMLGGKQVVAGVSGVSKEQPKDDAQSEVFEFSEHFPLSVLVQGDATNQRLLYARALEIQEDVYGAEHCELVVPLTKLGNVWGRLGCFQRKYDLLERALNIQLKELGPQHREVAVIRFNLAQALHSLGSRDEAIKLMKTAKKGLVENFGEKHRHSQAAARALKYWSPSQKEAHGAHAHKRNASPPKIKRSATCVV